MNTWGTTLAVAALLAVSACGGGSRSSQTAGNTASAKPTAKPAVKQVDSAATIGKMIGCTGPLKVDTQSMAQEERYCKVGRHLVSIVRASDRSNLMAYARMGEAFGANVALVNDHWGISSTSRAMVSKLAKRNGWRLL